MRKTSISCRGEKAPFSPIRKLTPFADQAKKEGVKVYHLNIGQPDFLLPSAIAKELKKNSDCPYLPYAPSQGMPELLKSWSSYYKSLGLQMIPDEIVITTGGSEGLIYTFAAICDPNDEIIVFEPFYANYNGFANLVSAKIVPVELDPENGYHLPSKEMIASKITEKTKAIIITSPNNPTGTVYSDQELRMIMDIAKESDLFIISDEAYFGISFGKEDAKNILQIADNTEHDRIIMIDSVSKRLNVCGARIGAIASKNKLFMSAINRFAQERLSVATLDQLIVCKALANCKNYVKKIAKNYQSRRDALLSTLEKELNIKMHYPEGAFYAMLKLPFHNADNFAKWLLSDFRYQNETVMVAPGSGFYATEGLGENEIRLAYVLNRSDLKKAAKILAKAILEYSKKIEAAY